MIAIPAVIYLVMLLRVRFPLSEREQAGVTYREMLAEFGAFGAFVGFGLIFWQLQDVFGWHSAITIALTVVMAIAFGAYTRSVGRPILAYLIIIMMPLATTEIGTDGWITGLMHEPMTRAGFDPGWILVYTSAIMMTLRFFAGPIVHSLSPIGLLIVSSILAIAGLYSLSLTGDAALIVILLAATLYGFGKTFFWPTMLGITAEQCPKGGALTLNAISGIGMIAVGVLGFPFIGALQEGTASSELKATSEQMAQTVLVESQKFGFPYQAIDPVKAKEVTDEEGQAALKAADKAGQFAALAKMAFFPAFMLLCYVILFVYFKSRGGYHAQVLVGHKAVDEEYTGGVEGAVE
jgi:hypothetical protein